MNNGLEFFYLALQGGKGFAKKISFEQIKFVSVDNPITINQFYCPNRQKCPNKVRTKKGEYQFLMKNTAQKILI